VQPVQAEQAERMQGQMQQVSEPQRAVQTAAQMLSELSQFAGVVLVPRRGAAFHQVEFLRLSERRVLMIIVGSDGDVQNRILVTDRPYSAGQLVEAANVLNQNYAGLSFDEVRSRLVGDLARLKGEIAGLMEAAVHAGAQAAADAGADPVFISGERRLLGATDIAASMEQMRALVDLFEHKSRLIGLLDESSRSHGVKIYIGGESELVPLDDMSMVVAPYEAHGRVLGTLGVIGPTRMAYERVIPIVDITARLLSSALSLDSHPGGA
jgi:heat-inducible transcriptional repressor